MTDKKTATEQQENNNSKGGGNLQGRVSNTANPDYREHEDNADISHVDRQEGDMDNGALGGNFGNEENNRNSG